MRLEDWYLKGTKKWLPLMEYRDKTIKDLYLCSGEVDAPVAILLRFTDGSAVRMAIHGEVVAVNLDQQKEHQ